MQLSLFARYRLFSFLFFAVELVEPPKTDVLAWSKGDPLPARQAFATIWKDGKTNMVVVDVSTETVVSHDLYTGSGKPLLSAADFAVSLHAIVRRNDTRWWNCNRFLQMH